MITTIIHQVLNESLKSIMQAVESCETNASQATEKCENSVNESFSNVIQEVDMCVNHSIEAAKTCGNTVSNALKNITQAVDTTSEAAETCERAENEVSRAVEQCQTNTPTITGFTIGLCALIVLLQLCTICCVTRPNCNRENPSCWRNHCCSCHGGSPSTIQPEISQQQNQK